MGLLHLLAQGGLYLSERLIVAHLNHGLRPEAGIEEVYVAETAAAWGLDYRSSRADIAEISSERKMSIEEAARWVRYRFLAEVAQSNEAAAVATGHNADDQAETVLMHFLRGSGLAGLRGMRPVGPLPGAPKVTLVRPLLAVRAKQIRDYCRENGRNPVEDDSNEDMTLPLLAGYNPNIIESLHNTAEVVAADYDLLMKLQEDAWSSILLTAGEGWLQLDRSGWRRLPLGLRRSALRQACEILKPLLRDVGFRPVEQARLVAESGQVGARSSLPGQLLLTVGYGSLTLSLAGATLPVPEAPQIQPESHQIRPIPGRLDLGGGWTMQAEIRENVSLQEVVGIRSRWKVMLDPGDLAEVVVRPRAPGERFQPLGMSGKSALVSDVMVNRKIPASLRAGWPIVAGRDHLLWLVGHHIDERARVTAGSRRVLQLTVEGNP
jgi:tRNA(Ile)-lysidine synthase